jgi:hypothetical protein
MDADRFDVLTRTLGSGVERRRVLGGLLGGLAAAVGGQRVMLAKQCAKEGQKEQPKKPCCAGLTASDPGGRCINLPCDPACEACEHCVQGSCEADPEQAGHSCNTEGGTCLSNGTCLTPCRNIDLSLACPFEPIGTCGCSGASDNKAYCSSSEATGTCTSLADCPQGKFCVGAGLGCRAACSA